MATLWFCIVSVMVAMYVVFDGFDIGVGVVHLFGTRDEGERRALLRSIGPVWDGNEVWLLAAGGVLYFAFPPVYARSFSGFYLPLMMVLWLLIGRALALELRNHVDHPMWKGFFDRLFGISSLLLAVFFGAALGNVVRGVPMQDASGRFFEPLFTHWGTEGEVGILDWYTVLCGLTALATLTVHGALWAVLKTEGALRARARTMALAVWWPLGALAALLTLATFAVQPMVEDHIFGSPGLLAFPALALAGFVSMRVFALRGCERRAFLASAAFIVGMLTSAVGGLYPYLLPSLTDPAWGLSVHNAAAPAYGLRIGLMWWIPGMVLVTIYFVTVYRTWAGKVTADSPGYHDDPARAGAAHATEGPPAE